MYETFEHTADLGLRVKAADLPGLFCDAARGLFSIIVANLDDVALLEQQSFEIAGQRHDELLFDWLSELLYVFESRRLLAKRSWPSHGNPGYWTASPPRNFRPINSPARSSESWPAGPWAGFSSGQTCWCMKR